MSIFNRITSVVDNPAQIAKLQKIIDRRLEQYDIEINVIIDSCDRIRVSEEILEMEQTVIDRCLTDYDKEACPYMGREINSNWMEGGGDNLEVRKRVLYRELNSKRGKLATVLNQRFEKARSQYESYCIVIEHFETSTLSLLPMNPSSLETMIEENLFQELDHSVRTNGYKQGFDQFNHFMNGSLWNIYSASRQRLINQNDSILKEKKEAFHKKYMESLFTVLHDKILKTTEEFENSITMEEEDEKLFTSSSSVPNRAIEDVRVEIDTVIGSLLEELKVNFVSFSSV
jgi:hypothetical protein